MEILGLDVGGSGIKGAIVDITTGELRSERYRLPTPSSATPDAMAETVKAIVNHFHWTKPVGCCFPTVVKKGRCYTFGNLDPSWVGVQVDELLSRTCNTTFHVGNDADLAGIAEMQMGAGRGKQGKVVMVTIGTGIGTGFFNNGDLVPNIELGRIFHTDGRPIEFYAADSARKKENLSLKEWAKRFDFFLHHVNRIFSPDHLIIGGGLSKKFDKFHPRLTVEIPMEVAEFKNNAGIIGAALYANNKTPHASQ
ncbi:MAG: ROK family protein [Bacteroidia bacterium]|nr:ROK family protein [Bacteroidia bacterium]